MTPEDLLERARAIAERAYAPYSNFRVGAVVLADDGRIFDGVNVENAAYPSTNCAEAIAAGAAATAGVRKFAAVAVACIDAASLEGSYPCGRCRQILSEFDPETVYVTNAEDAYRSHSLDELLPYGFKL